VHPIRRAPQTRHKPRLGEPSKVTTANRPCQLPPGLAGMFASAPETASRSPTHTPRERQNGLAWGRQRQATGARVLAESSAATAFASRGPSVVGVQLGGPEWACLGTNRRAKNDITRRGWACQSLSVVVARELLLPSPATPNPGALHVEAASHTAGQRPRDLQEG